MWLISLAVSQIILIIIVKYNSIRKLSTSDESVVGELLMKVEGENVPRTLVFYKQQHKYIVVSYYLNNLFGILFIQLCEL